MQNHNSRCFDVILIRFVSHEFRQDSKTLIEVRMPCVSKKTKERSITPKLDTNGVGLLEITNTLSIPYRSIGGEIESIAANVHAYTKLRRN